LHVCAILWKGNVSMAINRTHLILMTILSKHNATSAGTAISTEEIKQFCAIGKSNTTLHRAFCFLRSNNYIEQGVKDGKFFTYYITNQGIQLLKEML